MISGRINQIGPVARFTPGTETAPSRPHPSTPCLCRAYTYQYSFATGDVNGDGNPDLLVGEKEAPLLILGFIWETDTATLPRIRIPTIVNTVAIFRREPDGAGPAEQSGSSSPTGDNRLDVLIPLLDSFVPPAI